MGTCSYCGARFPRTRSTRKYCSSRCKTNACLTRKPSRIRAADVQALHELLDSDFASVEVLQDRLRSILRPSSPALPVDDRGRVILSRLD